MTSSTASTRYILYDVQQQQNEADLLIPLLIKLICSWLVNHDYLIVRFVWRLVQHTRIHIGTLLYGISVRPL